ncbi:MAG: DUF1761 domain-containing protein [Actinomycetota bacterium]
MTFELLGELNWLAVIVAALAYFAIGALWYSPPVLGNRWQAAAGTSTPAGGDGPGPAVYLVPLVGSALSAIALGMITEATGTDTVSEGLVLGLVVGIGFAIGIAMVTATFETSKPKPMTWGAINAGYHVVGNLAAAVILAVWN